MLYTKVFMFFCFLRKYLNYWKDMSYWFYNNFELNYILGNYIHWKILKKLWEAHTRFTFKFDWSSMRNNALTIIFILSRIIFIQVFFNAVHSRGKRRRIIDCTLIMKTFFMNIYNVLKPFLKLFKYWSLKSHN